MPTYDYRCNNCKHAMELFQSMKDAPVRKCPKCGKGSLERLIGTGAAVIFKGSGFYQTDYRSESYKKSAEAADKPATTTTSDKPAEKPATGDKAEPAKAAEPVAEKPAKTPRTSSAKASRSATSTKRPKKKGAR